MSDQWKSKATDNFHLIAVHCSPVPWLNITRSKRAEAYYCTKYSYITTAARPPKYLVMRLTGKATLPGVAGEDVGKLAAESVGT